MIIGVISDTHGNIDRTRKAVDEFRRRDITVVFHCGDINTPAVMELFAGFEVLFVFGNADRERQALYGKASEQFGTESIREVQTRELGGKRIAMTHGHTEALRELLAGNGYDYVLSGHTHVRKDERIGEMRHVNPGAIAGLRRQSRSCATIDLETDRVSFLRIR